MKIRTLIITGTFTLTLLTAFILWKYIPWKTISLQPSMVSISGLLPFGYYAVIISVAVTIIALIWIPKRQVRALHKPESSIVIGEHKISVEGFTYNHQNAIKRSELFDKENEARKTLSQIIGGFVVIVGLLFTGASLAITQQEAEKNRTLALEGQVTDRFTKAITQLGDTKLEVRLGGIYALERIAKDSPKDHWTIMEVLTAYVRERTSLKSKPSRIDNESEVPSSIDIQAIISVIARRPRSYLNGEAGRLNLSNAILRNIKFAEDLPPGIIVNEVAKLPQEYRRADFSGADFSGSELQGADFNFTQLSGATFKGSNLSGATMYKANLNSANLREAVLCKTQLSSVDLRGALLESADLSKAALDFTLLEGAHLDGANLKEAILQGADLSRIRPFYFEVIEPAFISEETKLPPGFEMRKQEKLRKMIGQ